MFLRIKSYEVMKWPEFALFTCFRVVFAWLLASVPAAAFCQVITLQNDAYNVVYDCQLSIPIYCEYICSPSNFGNIPRSKVGDFKVDKRVPKPRAKQKDYNNSGYQRGHLCPSADFACCLDLMKSTYLLTNVVPMKPSLNEGNWKTTEIAARQLAVKFGAVRVRVWVFTQSVGRRSLPRSCVTIPTRFCKQISAISNDSLLTEFSFSNY